MGVPDRYLDSITFKMPLRIGKYNEKAGLVEQPMSCIVSWFEILLIEHFQLISFLLSFVYIHFQCNVFLGLELATSSVSACLEA